MLTDEQLHDELAAYGAWIARRAGGDVLFGSTDADGGSRSDHRLVEVGLDDEGAVARRDRARSRPPRWLIAAAVLLVCTGVVAVTVVRKVSAPSSPAEQPVDPPGAMDVLPGAASGFGAINGHLSAVDATDVPDGNVLIVGTSEGSVHRHLLAVSAGPRPGDPSTEWDEVELPSGPVLVSTDASITLVTQQRGARWLTVRGRPAEAQAALDVVDHLTVADDGTTSVDSTAGLDQIAEVAPGAWTAGVEGTFAELVDAETGAAAGITVETMASPSPLLPAPFTADEVESITVRGVPGWRLSRPADDGGWNGLTWMATPNRAVAVSGHVPFADIVAAAEGLVITDEASWTTALPDHTTD